nr:copper resistance protein CopC [Actinomycetota bacterium]
MRFARVLAAATFAAVLIPSAAAAHAYLVSSRPADRAVLASAPREVRLEFTEDVRPGQGIAAVRNGGGSVLAGPARAQGRALVIPLRSDLGDGVYTARWQVISDDGHTTGGVLAFGVGSGSAPTPSLSAGSTGAGPGQYAVRWLFFIGLLVASGAAVFRIVVWRPALLDELQGEEQARAEQQERRVGPLLAAGGFAVALLGAGLLLYLTHAGWDTRFGRVLEIGLGIAAVGLLAALGSIKVPWIRPIALAAALAMLPLPTLAGHALDQGRAVLGLILDVAHVTAAAVWIGGLAALALALWTGDRGLRLPLARRFSALALAAVILLAGTGVGRALEELQSFSQLWSTGYGRAILVKTGLLVLLVALAARNRLLFLSGTVARLRRGVTAEAVLLLGLVVAVAVLTALPPGRTAAAASRLRPVPLGPSSPALPPRDALVLAKESGRLGVALAVRPGPAGRLRLTATVVSPSNTGVDDLALNFRVVGTRGATLEPGSSCGSGCYSATSEDVGAPASVTVLFAGETAAAVRFEIPT